jgi:hypothetical protein
MKKKLLLTLISMSVFFISSCDGIQDLLDDNPRNLGFVQKGLKAGAATAGVTAGSLSAEGGNGALIYTLVPGVGDEDNEFFALEGTVLKITAENLDQYDYSFRVKVEDGKGQSLEGSFTLKVGPPDGNSEPEDPDAPNVPSVPGGTDNPGSGDPDDPGEGGEGDNSGGQAVGKPERVGAIVSRLDMRMIHLSWEATDRATSYEVRYSEGKNLALATKFAIEPTEPAVTVTGLSDGTAYNFWVVAKNSNGAAMASTMHAAKRTSDPIPEFLLYGLSLSDSSEAYFKASNYSDAYRIEDLGEECPVNERYPFGYMGGPGMTWYHPGVIVFVRCFSGSDTESYSGINAAGCIVYRYMVSGQEKFHATYYSRGHLDTPLKDYQGNYSTPPAAVMGQANGYLSGLNADPTNTLQEAIDKYAHKGGAPGGTGGLYDYFAPMTIFYGFIKNYIKNY